MVALLKLMALGAGLVTIGCTPPVQQTLKAPAEAHVNVPVQLVVAGPSAANDGYVWTASSGRFEGQTNGPLATFVPAQTGSVSVVCTITSADGRSTVLDATMAVSDGTSPQQSNEATPPQDQNQAGAGVALDVEKAGYLASGLMGDGEIPGQVTLDEANRERPHSLPSCNRIEYRPGRARWAAIAWQFPASNFGDMPGKDLRNKGHRTVSVWARGVPDRSGLYPTVQFKAGGHTDPAKKFQATFAVEGDPVKLTGDWREYTLSLVGKDLSNVIAAFVVVIKAQDVGPNGATFFIDDIVYR